MDATNLNSVANVCCILQFAFLCHFVHDLQLDLVSLLFVSFFFIYSILNFRLLICSCIRESTPADKVKEAHRRVMVANHPDAGGSHYLASKINEAKDVMLRRTKGSSSAF